jgi:hypothetical protein
MNRREFIATGAACAALAGAPESAMAKPKKRNTLSVFTKPLQMLSYDELAEVVVELGFDGIEGTIRPGGQITPEQVPDELPKMVAALKKRNLEMTIMASGVNDPRDKVSMRQLEVAAKLGVKRYRMKYFKYDLKRPVAGQLDEIRPQLKDLVATRRLGFRPSTKTIQAAITLARPCGICGCYSRNIRLSTWRWRWTRATRQWRAPIPGPSRQTCCARILARCT